MIIVKLLKEEQCVNTSDSECDICCRWRYSEL